MENELYHHGIKGMKWGVRKRRTTSSSSHKRNPTKGWSKDAKAAYSMKKKGIKGMSNAELKRANERQRLENEYRNLNPSKIKRGLAVAGAIAGTLGTINNLYTNGDKIVTLGKNVAKRFVK